MEKRYARAYTEVLEILKHIPEEEYNLIPKAEIQYYESNCDKNYHFEFNEEDIKENGLSREANAIIVSIYMNYFANEKQKGIINEILKQNSVRENEEKKKKYSVDNLFNANNQNDTNNEEMDEEKLPVQVKEDGFFKKIINKLKNIFKR